MVRSHAVDAAPPVAAVALGLPARVSLYLEMSKPRLSLLAVASAVVGYLLAGGEPGVPMLALGVGSFLMSAGSSLLNQVLEREHDARMVRTRGRALPSGRISPEEALGVGILTGLTGAVLLAQLVHPLSAALGVAVLTGYVLLYTPLKRRTSLNTFVGAVVGALPVAMGTVAAAGKAEEVGAALFAIQFLWQLPHFWAIAWLHREDYRGGGFAMLTRDDETGRITGLHALAAALLLIPVALVPSVLRLAGPLYFAGALGMGVALVALALGFALRPTDDGARGLFRYSLVHLPLLFALLLIDKVGR